MKCDIEFSLLKAGDRFSVGCLNGLTGWFSEPDQAAVVYLKLNEKTVEGRKVNAKVLGKKGKYCWITPSRRVELLNKVAVAA